MQDRTRELKLLPVGTSGVFDMVSIQINLNVHSDVGMQNTKLVADVARLTFQAHNSQASHVECIL